MVDALVDYDDNRFRLLYLVVTLADYDHNRGCRIDSESRLRFFSLLVMSCVFKNTFFCKNGCLLLVVSAAV